MDSEKVSGARHSRAHHFSASGLFSGLTSFAELEQRISDRLPTPQERGDAFEVFAEAYLATQPIRGAAEVWPGKGNIKNNPRFCGGWEESEVFVEDQRGFEDALGAFDFSVALSPESPCLGTGLGGVNMGADGGVCDVRGVGGGD